MATPVATQQTDADKLWKAAYQVMNLIKDCPQALKTLKESTGTWTEKVKASPTPTLESYRDIRWIRVDAIPQAIDILTQVSTQCSHPPFSEEAIKTIYSVGSAYKIIEPRLQWVVDTRQVVANAITNLTAFKNALETYSVIVKKELNEGLTPETTTWKASVKGIYSYPYLDAAMRQLSNKERVETALEPHSERWDELAKEVTTLFEKIMNLTKIDE